MQNLVILAGNVGATPETRTTQGGTRITHFSLATSRPKRDSNGKILRDDNNRRLEDTEWHRITCFNGVGKTVEQYVDKGMKVMVRGRIHYTSTSRRLVDDVQLLLLRLGIRSTIRTVRGSPGRPGHQLQIDGRDEQMAFLHQVEVVGQRSVRAHQLRQRLATVPADSDVDDAPPVRIETVQSVARSRRLPGLSLPSSTIAFSLDDDVWKSGQMTSIMRTVCSPVAVGHGAKKSCMP